MFALVDCNNFYASCEKVFDPSLRGKCVVVLSNNDGCIVARSKEAKEMGIAMGAPIFEYKEFVKAKKLLTFSANFPLYADMSKRVMQTLETFDFPIEIYSIDEAFLYLENMEEEKLFSVGKSIQKKVYMWTGIAVSVGIAPTKTLAKLANKMAKKADGAYVLTEDKKIDSTLEKIEPVDIWGVGRRLAKKLKKLSIFTGKDLKYCHLDLIKKKLGINTYRSVLELRKTPCFSCEEEFEKRKSIVCSRTFANKLTDLKQIEEALSHFIATASEKLRNQNSLTTFMGIFLSTSPFDENYYSNSSFISLPNPTAYTPELLTFGKTILQKIYQSHFAYKRAGVFFADFVEENSKQLDLFNKTEYTQNKKELMNTVDHIRREYGRGSIYFASEGIKAKWKKKPLNKSPQYTTKWSDIPKISH